MKTKHFRVSFSVSRGQWGLVRVNNRNMKCIRGLTQRGFATIPMTCDSLPSSPVPTHGGPTTPSYRFAEHVACPLEDGNTQDGDSSNGPAPSYTRCNTCRGVALTKRPLLPLLAECNTSLYFCLPSGGLHPPNPTSYLPRRRGLLSQEGSRRARRKKVRIQGSQLKPRAIDSTF